jgi:integrase
MIDAGRERKSINRNIGRITRMFRWAVAQEFCPPQVITALESVDGLRSGRSSAIEIEDVKPALLEHVEAVSTFVTRPVWGLIRFQLATACRPGEAIIMRGCDITMMGDVWKYVPASHKTEHHGKGRTILIGPQGQAVVREFLNTDLQSYLFNPQAADPRRTKAKTHRPGERYRRDSYTTAVRRACVKADVPIWTPNQLRHTAATAIRAVADLDTARAVLGHSSLTTAEIYAERDTATAHEIMRRIG